MPALSNVIITLRDLIRDSSIFRTTAFTFLLLAGLSALEWCSLRLSLALFGCLSGLGTAGSGSSRSVLTGLLLPQKADARKGNQSQSRHPDACHAHYLHLDAIKTE